MAFEIPDHFHKQFTTNVELLLQEKMPVLLPAVMSESFSGEAAQVIKQFGEVEFQEKTTRHGDTNFSDIQHKQRWIFPTDYDLALPVDKEDELRMLDSPVSPYVAAMRAAYARKVNAVIRDALLGSAKTGKNGGTTTAFDTTNQRIAVDYVESGATASSNLTVAKLRRANEILRANHALEEGEQPTIAVAASQINALLRDTNVTSSDFNTVRALVNGEIDTFMGFKFVHYESLAYSSGTIRRVPVWVKSGCTFGQWNGLETHIDVRPDKKYLTQVFMKATIGATRSQETKVVEILCDEA